MARLKATWELKEELNNLDMSEELRNQVNETINRYESRKLGTGSFLGIYQRGNLHYIIDNINKSTLLAELTEHNNVNN